MRVARRAGARPHSTAVMSDTHQCVDEHASIEREVELDRRRAVAPMRR